VFVPRYRKGNWIYDENSWNISVSNRSSNRKEAGKHIDTFSQMEREIILHYIESKGYRLGKSRFEYRPLDYELKEKGERWAEKRKEVKGKKRLMEIIEESGLSNNYKLRDELNIIYFLDLEKSMPEWPWSFKLRNKGGFGM